MWLALKNELLKLLWSAWSSSGPDAKVSSAKAFLNAEKQITVEQFCGASAEVLDQPPPQCPWSQWVHSSAILCGVCRHHIISHAQSILLATGSTALLARGCSVGLASALSLGMSGSVRIYKNAVHQTLMFSLPNAVFQKQYSVRDMM